MILSFYKFHRVHKDGANAEGCKSTQTIKRDGAVKPKSPFGSTEKGVYSEAELGCFLRPNWTVNMNRGVGVGGSKSPGAQQSEKEITRKDSWKKQKGIITT
mmetsp:Transcript_15160/g.31218  ORF Transcript_15160/g.31218 Transcript_15160/m.31218 type:complete len:101 (+) Transcript_15160:211-513(+)